MTSKEQQVCIISVELGFVPCNVVETLKIKREELRNRKKNNKFAKGPKCMQ